MSSIQKTLDSLQPYVIGIRYLEGLPLVDTVFKEGWTVPDDPKITKVKGDEGMNYYMIYSENKSVGIDDLLAFVDKTIKLNQEREKKHELLRIKVEELKKIFKETPLTKLSRLKFTFTEEDIVPPISDFDLNIEDEPENQIAQLPETTSETYQEPVIYTAEMIDAMEAEHESISKQTSAAQFLDENGNPIEYTEEELEMIEEEARAERNRQMFKNKKNGVTSKVELPPRA
jgi:hypothetical protein